MQVCGVSNLYHNFKGPILGMEVRKTCTKMLLRPNLVHVFLNFGPKRGPLELC